MMTKRILKPQLVLGVVVLAMLLIFLKTGRHLVTFVYDLKYTKADVVAEKLRLRMNAKVVKTIEAEERSNQLLVRVVPSYQMEVEKIIRSLDEPPQEILIEAKILEIFIKPPEAGIDWQAAFSQKDGKKVDFKNISLNEAGGAAMTVGNIGSSDFILALRSLQQISDSRILSRPQILIANKQEARIHVGDTVPYLATTVNDRGENAMPSHGVQFMDIGLKLDVTPTINENGMLTMHLHPEVSSVSETMEADTSVVVKDGQTIMMAGLRNDIKSDNIPSRQIVVLITPHIVKGAPW